MSSDIDDRSAFILFIFIAAGNIIFSIYWIKAYMREVLLKLKRSKLGAKFLSAKKQ